MRQHHESPGRAPVVLVHGFLSDPRCFAFMGRHLRRAGFDRLSSFRYRPFGQGIVEIAAGLGRHVAGVLGETNAERVHVVGHSLGGLVARAHTQLLGGDATVLSSVSLGTPEDGTPIAHLGFGRIARDLRPRSELIRRLEVAAAPNRARVVAFYGARDRIAAPPDAVRSDRLDRTVVFNGVGHIGLLFSSAVAAALIGELVASEAPAACSPSAETTVVRQAGSVRRCAHRMSADGRADPARGR